LIKCKILADVTVTVVSILCSADVVWLVVRGPLMALVLEKEEAVEAWKNLLGPFELDVALIEAPDRLVQGFFTEGIGTSWGLSFLLENDVSQASVLRL